MNSQYTCAVGTMRSVGSTDTLAFALINCAWPSWIRHCNCMLRSARLASACTVTAGISITVKSAMALTLPFPRPFYESGPARQVPGRHRTTYTEEDWLDDEATSHRGLEE